MPSHLLISVTFLQPACHARLGKEDAAPNEWPPSPLRLFQAMVAGAAARWAGDSGSTRATLTAEVPVTALKWLENLCAEAPPTIVAPRAVTGQTVPRWVPNNSADLVAAKWSRGDALATFDDRAMKVFRPTLLLDGSTVHYAWRLSDDQRHEARGLESTFTAVARCIVALGWGIDTAIGDARIVSDDDLSSLAGERWKPEATGSAFCGLRLPCPGTLDALITRHASFLDRLKDGVFHPVPPLRAFTTVAYRQAWALPRRPFAAFILRPVEVDAGYAAFPATHANRVAAMLRHAACGAAKADLDDHPGAWRDDEWALRFVAGHGPAHKSKREKDDDHPRFSYLPLPSIGHPHADGLIRRVMIAEPLGGDGRSALWAARRVADAILEDEDRGPVARLEPVEPDEVEFGRVFRLYGRRSNHDAVQIWASITPVILPGYDDNNATKRERLLRDCLRHAGIDLGAVASVESRPTSWNGSISAPLSAWKRPSYLAHLPAVHVRLEFTHPVSGPVAIGAGRHCGLGVCAVESSA